ncbi:MAG: adenylyltransferase/cytidyltransferase family protein [Candidatus Aenigmarchaeota archaeon]|nr:adenylyltransferase/cytidyltransferase family protein [Candidatus Aenigmarchaeota archaeon]
MKVLVGGTFNAIHPGHVEFLNHAKTNGTLVVVIAHDAHNAKPYAKPATERKKNVESLHIADHVFVGDATDYWKIVEQEKPNIILLGYDQQLPEHGESIIQKLHIRVLRAEKFGTCATRKLAHR